MQGTHIYDRTHVRKTTDENRKIVYVYLFLLLFYSTIWKSCYLYFTLLYFTIYTHIWYLKYK